MKQVIFSIKENKEIARNTYKMVLSGDTSGIGGCGQFVNIALPGLYLRRPISVCDYKDGSLTLIYKAVGEGTELMSRLDAGTELDILVGLGNGYDTSKSGKYPLLLGGGVGVPPLYALCKKLIAEGKEPTVILGFNTKDEVFCTDDFKALGARVFVTTADGSFGIKGFVTDAMEEAGNYTYFYTCGPTPMLKAVFAATATSGQFSFEERMGCGFGACMGCSCKTNFGNKRVCKDGPVFEKEEILW